MLQTPIATFLDGKWVFYFPCFRLDGQSTRLSGSQPLENTKVIYLLNINKHYSPVISIKDEMSYAIEEEKIKTRLQMDSLSAYLAEKALKCKQWTQDQLKQEVGELFDWLSNLAAVKSNKICFPSKHKQVFSLL
uniref:Uncharacterized protein n=1 Tax=Ditylenchus dipsaci TaxID=166011 RepID=A0A915DCD4_9BILA